MAISTLHCVVIWAMYLCAVSVKVAHELPDSEMLDIIKRSWVLNGISMENYFQDKLQTADDNELVVFLTRPRSINVCDSDRYQNVILPMEDRKVIVDDAVDPSILIGSWLTIKDHHLRGINVEKVLDKDLIYMLDDDVGVGMRENNSLYNYETRGSPCILSAPSDKLNLLFRFANYIPRVNSAVTWPDSNNWHGYCHICDDVPKSPGQIKKDDMIVIAGFIFEWTPLLYNWLTMLLNQEVKAKKFYIIYNNVTEHNKIIEEITGSVEYDGLVLDSTFFKDKDLSDIRGHSSVMCTALECKYLFTVDSEVALLRSNIIPHLIQYNKTVITTLVASGRNSSNFWGDITEDGWYRRSPDYFDIVDGAWGLFVVPYIKSMYLTRSDALPDYNGNDKYSDSDTDMAMCGNYRNKTTLMWLVTTLNCAVYTDMTPPEVPLPLPNPDLYAAATNWHSWVDFSLNKPVAFNVLPVGEVMGGCSEENLVLPLFTEVYCRAFVKAFSSYTWTKSSNSLIQKIQITELKYHLIVEGVVRKSVIPYIKHLYNIDVEFEVSHEDMFLFIQEPENDTDLQVKQESGTSLRAFHIVWFWADNENQGINYTDKSCKVHLPAGTLLVIEDTGDRALDLISSETRNIGMYARVTNDRDLKEPVRPTLGRE